MAREPDRIGARWLELRESADAAARATGLVDGLRDLLPSGELEIHDLGCGSGSMARWLAPQLPGPQRWTLYDRDEELLSIAAARAGRGASDGAWVSVRTQCRDVTRLAPVDLAGASLVTASALLDLLTREELDRVVDLVAAVGCPALIALSVTGEVVLEPPSPLDDQVSVAFNAHQRRAVGGVPRLGPDAPAAAADSFARHGYEVLIQPSPWRLGPGDRELVEAWFPQWLAAACEQQGDLRGSAGAYARHRLSQMAAAGLSVTVGHVDIQARPR